MGKFVQAKVCENFHRHNFQCCQSHPHQPGDAHIGEKTIFEKFKIDKRASCSSKDGITQSSTATTTTTTTTTVKTEEMDGWPAMVFELLA